MVVSSTRSSDCHADRSVMRATYGGDPQPFHNPPFVPVPGLTSLVLLVLSSVEMSLRLSRDDNEVEASLSMASAVVGPRVDIRTKVFRGEREGIHALLWPKYRTIQSRTSTTERNGADGIAPSSSSSPLLLLLSSPLDDGRKKRSLLDINNVIFCGRRKLWAACPSITVRLFSC